MTWEDKDLQLALDEAILRLAGGGTTGTAASVRSIVFHNLAQGRVKHFLDGQNGCEPYDYVLMVSRYYENLSPYLYRVQVEKAAEDWQPLYEKIRRLAYTYLLHKGFEPGSRSYTFAEDCAGLAGARLVGAYFPYDTDFEPWLCILVQYTCRGQMKESYEAAGNRGLYLADMEDYLMNTLRDTASDEDYHRANLQLDLLDAIRQLCPPACQEVVLLRYYEGLTLKQIACRMKTSTTTVHGLHFSALEELRKILGRNGYK